MGGCVSVFISGGEFHEVLKPGAGTKCFLKGGCWALLCVPYPRGECADPQPIWAGHVVANEMDELRISPSPPPSPPLLIHP